MSAGRKRFGGREMVDFITFNWQIFKMLGLVSANALLLCFLVALFGTILRNIFGGWGDDDE